MQRPLDRTFVDQAAKVLANTQFGLTGPRIVDAMNEYSYEFNVTIPHPSYPFDSFRVPNKRTALAENLMAFSEEQRYRIIKELCDDPYITERNAEGVRDLKLKLITRFGHLEGEALGPEINDELIAQTRDWLWACPDAQRLFDEALRKYKAGAFVRNLLDDLRLALEKLVQTLVGNDKSLENQLAAIGGFVKQRGGSKELSNMFVTLVDYYCKYQNTYVKHDDAVIEQEIEFIVEMTAAFMKHLLRLAKQ